MPKRSSPLPEPRRAAADWLKEVDTRPTAEILRDSGPWERFSTVKKILLNGMTRKQLERGY